MNECSLAQECEGERKGTGATNHPCCLCLAVPLSPVILCLKPYYPVTGLLVQFHAVPRSGAPRILLSGLAPPLGFVPRGRSLWAILGLVSGWLMVEDIPLVVWGLCFGKVGEVISCLFGPVRGYRRTWPQCLLTPPVSTAIVCVGGLVCYI